MSESHVVPEDPQLAEKEAKKVEYELAKMDLKERLADLGEKIRAGENTRDKKSLKALESEFGKVSAKLSRLGVTQ